MGVLHSAIRARISARAAEADMVVVFAQNDEHAMKTARRYGIAFDKVIAFGWEDPKWGMVKVQRARFTDCSLFLGEWGCEAELRARFPASFEGRTVSDGWAP